MAARLKIARMAEISLSREGEPQSGDFHSMPYLAKIELIVPLAFSLSRDVLILFRSSRSVLRTPSASGPVIKDR